jgi:retron-type reverse transcriptase
MHYNNSIIEEKRKYQSLPSRASIEIKTLTDSLGTNKNANLKQLILSKLMYDDSGRCTNAYEIISSLDVLRQAYFHIKSKPGNLTPGTDGITLDGISLKYLEQLLELIHSDKFQPSPTRRIYIPKKNGKLRPLGIGSPRDKIVEQAFLFVLESVLEPKFSDLSHGFRPNRGCHTALRQLRN